MKKSAFSFFLCICAVVSLLIFSAPAVSAADVCQGKIEVGTVEGITGDIVAVPIKLTENPGIMAVTVSITYDPEVLKYKGAYYGDIFNDYTVANHPDRKLIRLVICEMRNKTNDGNIIILKFQVKDNAKAELTKIGLEYSRGDFCNWNLDKIMPTVTSGGINVAFNGENCPHKNYGKWTVVSKPTCVDKGLDERVCELCGHKEYKDTDPIGHTYSDKWTVDRPATAEKDGTMSRYCIRCDDYVDRVSFSLEQSEESDIKNDIWSEIPDNNVGNELFKEQFPDEELTPNQEKPDDTPLDVEDIIGEIIPEAETPDGENVSVLDKIAEAFPNYATWLKILIIAIVVLLILIII